MSTPLDPPERSSDDCRFTEVVPYCPTGGRVPAELATSAEICRRVGVVLDPDISALPRIDPRSRDAGRGGALCIFADAGTPARSFSPDCVAALVADARQFAPFVVVSRRRDVAERLANLSVGGASYWTLLSETSWEDYARLLEESTSVACPETATAHLAVALGKMVVAVLGGGHFGYFAPWSHTTKQLWISHPLPCFNCNWNCRYPTPHCLDGIAADFVVRELKRIALEASK